MLKVATQEYTKRSLIFTGPRSRSTARSSSSGITLESSGNAMVRLLGSENHASLLSNSTGWHCLMFVVVAVCEVDLRLECC